MDLSIAGILALDGVTNGAIYALLALATVLVFAVTRVIFIPQGEFVAYGALTLALLQTGKVPGTVWLLLVLAVAGRRCSTSVDGAAPSAAPRRVALRRAAHAAPGRSSSPAVAHAGRRRAAAAAGAGAARRWRSSRRSARCSTGSPTSRSPMRRVLVLLIVSVGVHFALTGLGLLFFGAEGFRNPSFWDARFYARRRSRSAGQALIIFARLGRADRRAVRCSSSARCTARRCARPR